MKVKDTAAITPPLPRPDPVIAAWRTPLPPGQGKARQGDGLPMQSKREPGQQQGVQKRREAMDQGMTGGKSLAAFAGFLMMESRFSDDDHDKRASDPALLERRESAAHSHEANSSPTT